VVGGDDAVDAGAVGAAGREVEEELVTDPAVGREAGTEAEGREELVGVVVPG